MHRYLNIRFLIALLILFTGLGCKKKKGDTAQPKDESVTLTEDYNKLGINFLARLYPKYWETFVGSVTVADIRDVAGVPYIFYYDDHVSVPKNIRLNMYGQLNDRHFNKFSYEGCGAGTEKVMFQLSHKGDLMNTYFDFPTYYLCNSQGIHAQTETEFKWIDELSGNLYAMNWMNYNGFTSGKPLLYAFQNNAKWTFLDTVQEVLPTQALASCLSPNGNIYLAYTALDNQSVNAAGYIVLQGYDGSNWVKLGKLPEPAVNDVALGFNRPYTVRVIPNGENPFILIARSTGMSVYRYYGGILEKITDNVSLPVDPKNYPFCVFNNELYTFNIGNDRGTNPVDAQRIYKLSGAQFDLYRTLNVQPSGGGTYAIRNMFSSNGRMFICTELMINSNVVSDIIELK